MGWLQTPLHWKTPLLESRTLSHALGQKVLLKMEAWQPVGSFKIRGMGRLCQHLVARGAKRLVSSSGGNAGYAVAYAGRLLGVSVTVVVPRTTPDWMRAKIRDEGAEVFEHGDSWDDAHAHAVGKARDPETGYVHPFDDPRIWEGHATLIEEVVTDGVKPSAVVVSVGGGGLLCGVLLGLHQAGLGDVPVLAVETRGADSFAATVQAGRLVTLPAITSLASTLGARTVAKELLDWTKRHRIVSRVVSDRAAVEACKQFADEHRVLVEPACGAALAALGEKPEVLLGKGPVLLIVCGGAGVSRELLEGWDQKSRSFENGS